MNFFLFICKINRRKQTLHTYKNHDKQGFKNSLARNVKKYMANKE